MSRAVQAALSLDNTNPRKGINLCFCVLPGLVPLFIGIAMLKHRQLWREKQPETKAEQEQAYRKSEKQANRDHNRGILEVSGIPFTLTNENRCALFREDGKPKVDFYLVSGRWRVVAGETKTFEGGAQGFLQWYASQ